jgi:molybdenum cofactor cytidylyltransferase
MSADPPDSPVSTVGLDAAASPEDVASRGGGGTRDGRVAGILLAAGSSTRMGDNKMLLPLGDETVLRRAARTAKQAGLDPVVVVTGHQAAEAEAQVADLDCLMVHNDEHEIGIHTSVKAGIAGLPGDVRATVVMLPDMPFVTAEMLAGLVATYRGGGAPLVISRYGGEVNAPPQLYDRALFGELSTMQRRCGREVIQRHRDEAVQLDWPEAALADMDTPEDYESARAGLEAGAM